MTDRFEPLNSGEVVSVYNDTQVLSGHRTFRVGELSDAIKAQLADAIAGWSEEKNGWFTQQGIDCEALRFGSNGWQKGRIRFCLEFCPDEPKIDINATISASIGADTIAPVLAVDREVSSPLHQGEPVEHHTEIHNHSTEFHSEIAATTSVPEITHSNIDAAVLAALGITAVGIAATTTAPTTGSPNVVLDELATSDSRISAPGEIWLETEQQQLGLTANQSEGCEEIAFDFDRPNDGWGTMRSNATMELDLTDLGLDIPEHDLFDFEANGLPDGSHEFINLQDIEDRPENSGMLIDEVWNEMSQPNWPGIN